MANKVVRSLLLTPEQRDWLNEHSRRTGIPASALIRLGVDQLRQRLQRDGAAGLVSDRQSAESAR